MNENYSRSDKMNTYQDMTEQQIWDELVSFFGNEYAAAAVLGNFENEGGTTGSTTMETRKAEGLGMTNLEYTQAVDSGSYDSESFVSDGIGYGMAQWTGARKEKLLNFAKANNASVGSTQLQIAFLEKELVDYENEHGWTILSDLKNAGSVAEASEIFMIRYEDCGTKSSENIRSRAMDSEKYYEKYAGTTSSGNNTTLLELFNSNSLDGVLSDVTIDIQIDSLNDICASWNQRIFGIDLDSVKVSEIFSPLLECGVAVSYIPSLESALKQATSLVNSVNNIIKTAGDDQVAVDDNSYNFTGTISSSGNFSYKGNSYSASSSSNPSTSVDNSNLNLEINTDMIQAINHLDFESYISFMRSLSSIVTTEESLTTYFSNSAYADILKEKLMNISSLPDNIKTIISDMDPKTLQVTLYSLITDSTVVTDISKSIMYNYLESLAKSSNLSMNELLKDRSSLVSIFTDMGSVSSVLNNSIINKTVASDLLNIYDGNSLQNTSNNTVLMVRELVEEIAEKKNITVESLLTESANSNYLNESITEAGKAYQYVSNVGYTDLNTASSILTNIFTKG